MKHLLYLFPIVGMLAACSHHTYSEKDPVVLGYPNTSANTTSEMPDEHPQRIITLTQPIVGMMPKATAFKMSGDYADKVAVTLDSNGKLTYFPAPSDISEASAPTSLGNGWWLNNQGISANSVFTKYTFEEYSKLPSTPSTQQLKDAIISGAKVTNMIQLPYSIGEVNDNLQEAKDYVKNL